MFDASKCPPTIIECPTTLFKVRDFYLMNGQCKGRIEMAEAWFTQFCNEGLIKEKSLSLYRTKMIFLQNYFLSAAAVAIVLPEVKS